MSNQYQSKVESGKTIAVFKDKKIRRTIHDKEWWFAIIDVVEVLTSSSRPRKYWSDLKKQLLEKEGFLQLSEKIGQLKLTSTDGKKYATDCANTETLFREISKATFGMTPTEYKEHKNLKRENLRDHMTDLELIFSMLGEASTTEIARSRNTKGFIQNKTAARNGGKIAGNARLELEQETGKNVISKDNYLGLLEEASEKDG